MYIYICFRGGYLVEVFPKDFYPQIGIVGLRKMARKKN